MNRVVLRVGRSGGTVRDIYDQPYDQAAHIIRTSGVRVLVLGDEAIINDL